MLMDAIIKLHEQISNEPLGVNRTKAIREAEQVALTSKPTAQMKGLLR
jgi:NADH-quinone oxidoreductase subunit B